MSCLPKSQIFSLIILTLPDLAVANTIDVDTCTIEDNGDATSCGLIDDAVSLLQFKAQLKVKRSGDADEAAPSLNPTAGNFSTYFHVRRPQPKDDLREAPPAVRDEAAGGVALLTPT